ncbi:hypothetical protein [Caulobacter sp.]|uniref:hypothetical protein n=1 Tax=Caulobacter sp. TaxID=78 RepID=UPI003BA9DD3D
MSRRRLLFVGVGVALLGALVVAFSTGLIAVQIDVATPKGGSFKDAVKLVALQQNIDVKKDGSLRLGGRPTTLETLEPDLATAFTRAHAPSDRSEQPVTIWAEEGAPRASIDAAYEKLLTSGWTEADLSMKTRQIQ